MVRAAIRVAAALAVFALAWPAAAAWAPDGVDLTRPRLLFRAGERAAIQAKLDQDPLPDALAHVLDFMEARIAEAGGVPLDDHHVGPERIKARAARDLAFLYAVDRTRVGGVVVPFPTPADRAAAGDRVREWLLAMYTHSRIGVFGELGGWDRDISTSEELLMYASAYDALAGSGFDFGGDESAIVENLVDLASELYLHYTRPETALTFPNLHQNNHRSKVGASLVMAAMAVAEYTPAPGTDPDGIRDPALWLPYGLDQVDQIIRHALVTGDGVYAEGPFYWRYSCLNLLPFARAWHGLVGDAEWPIGGGITVPSFWSHPLFRRSQRWMLDMTFPDGALVAIDDGNPGRSHFFGAARVPAGDEAAAAWRWANAPTRYETEGNVDLGPDSIVMFDPELVPAPPTTPPTVFYEEGGDAIFKSGWEDDAVMAVVTAEHDTASELGRKRDGTPAFPESHEHPDPGAFILHAFGQRLAIDPGYFSFSEHDRVNQAKHHNVILVDGKGPVDSLAASLEWGSTLSERPPADGQSRFADTLDGDFLDAARVVTSYGFGWGDAYPTAPLIQRRFLFPDHAYLVVADSIDTRDAQAHAFTWLVHGDGGGIALDGGPVDGDFAATAAGGRWTRSVARLDAGFAVAGQDPVVETGMEDHEEANGRELTHVVWKATAAGESLRSLLFTYPTRSAAAAPDVSRLALDGAAALVVHDPAGDRRVLAWHRATSGSPLAVPAATSGLSDAESDGQLALFDATDSGSLRLAWAEGARRIAYDGVTYLDRDEPGRIGIALAPDRADVVAEGGGGDVAVMGLAFTPRTADGACSLVTLPGQPPRVALGRDRRFRLLAAAQNARPAADPGPDMDFVIPPALLVLDGSASCDSDGDALAPHWELVSAPAPGAWKIEDTETWHPRLTVDAPGPYRVALTVTDEHGARSLPVEVHILAGAACQDGVDGDLDGLVDADDPGCSQGLGIVESPACSNGLDDDDDGLVDYPADPECPKPFAHSERLTYCGLGAELVLPFLAALTLARRARRRA